MSSSASFRLRDRGPRRWLVVASALASALTMVMLPASPLARVASAAAHPEFAGSSGGGPVVLDGMDPVCHSGGEATGGYIAAVLASLWQGSTRPSDGSIQVVGHAADANAGGCREALSLAMPEFLVGITPTPAVSYAGTEAEIDTFFAALAAGDVQPAVLWIPDTWDRSASVESTITAHASEMADFVNSGGALFANHNSYGWLTALLPSAVFNDGGCNGGPEVTAAGVAAFPSLTNELVTACWHGYFTGDTGSLVPLVDYPYPDPESPRVAVAIGGGSVTLPSVFSLQLPSDPQPVGTSATLSATVKNSSLVPQAGVVVTFAVISGPNSGFSDTATTDADGVASVTLAGTIPGTDTVTASFDADGATTSADGTVEWIGPDAGLELVLQLVPGQKVANGPVDVEGFGLMPSSTVQIELHSAPVVLGTVTTDSTGSFSTQVTLPAFVATGEHTVTVVGTSPSGGSVTAETDMFVDWSGALAGPVIPTGFTAISPIRILDTRGSVALAAGTTHRLNISSAVPDDVTAVAVNVTVTEPATAGYLTVYPCNSVRPWASAINFVAGESISNLVVPAFREGEELCFDATTATHLVVDLNGYYQTSSNEKFVGASPSRIADTRSTTTLAAGDTLEVAVTGDGLAAIASSAVSLHVTVTEPAAAGFLTVYPCGSARPWTANVNFATDQTVGNDVLAKVGDAGRVCIYTKAATDVVVDLNGWFVAGAGGANVRSLVPGRFVDTRQSIVVEAGQTLHLALVGSNAFGVGTTAVSLNVAVVNAANSGFLTVYACGGDRPMASNLNFVRGQTVASHVTSQVGDAGEVCLYSSATTHVIVDVEGSFSTPPI